MIFFMGISALNNAIFAYAKFCAGDRQLAWLHTLTSLFCAGIAVNLAFTEGRMP